MSITVKTAVIHGVAWLYSIEQPDGALVSHHGISVRVADQARTVWFVPRGVDRNPVIVLGVDARVPGHASASLVPGELESLARWCASIRTPVLRTWNGHPSETGSIELGAPAHPSLLRAVRTYTDGCPDHPRESVFCRCEWQRAGRAKLRLPHLFTRSEITV